MKRKLSFLFLILFFSCTYDNTYLIKKPGSEYFPNKTGNYWVYSVVDSTHIATGTKTYNVTVNIVGTRKLANDQTAFEWLYHYPDRVDTLYYISTNDSVKIYSRFALRDINFTYYSDIFYMPFFDGQSWNGKYLGTDNYTVAGIKSLTISNTTYSNVFSIFHHYLGPDIENKDQSFFTPNVGFIKMDNNDYNLAPRDHQIWLLQEYSLY